ncbi:ribokinase [Streptomyces hirsutus]
MVKVAVVGSYGAGLTMRLPRSPDAGETVSGGVFSPGPGGKGSNQAIGAARLGAQVSLLTAVGDDDFGRPLAHCGARKASRRITS